MIKCRLFGILNFDHCELFGICDLLDLLFEFFLLLKSETLRSQERVVR